MAQKSRPDPANGSVVNADEYEGLSLGSFTDGIVGTPADTAVVYADSTGRQVKVRSGKLANIRGYSWQSDPTADEIINNAGAGLPANTSSNPRIDRLVLRLDRAARTVRTQYLQGAPASTPVAPALTQSPSLTNGIWDLPLAKWNVANGYTTVAPADLTNEAWYRPPGGSGIIHCTSTSRPFGAYAYDGQEIYEYDSGVFRRYDSSAFLGGTPSWPMSRPWRKSSVVSANVPSVTLGNIPSTLRRLRVTCNVKSDSTAYKTLPMYIQINSDASARYSVQRNLLNNATPGAQTATGSGAGAVGQVTDSFYASAFGQSVIDITNWNAWTHPLTWTHNSIAIPTLADATLEFGGGTYIGPGPFTSIKFTLFAGNFVAGSEFHIEGWDYI